VPLNNKQTQGNLTFVKNVCFAYYYVLPRVYMYINILYFMFTYNFCFICHLQGQWVKWTMFFRLKKIAIITISHRVKTPRKICISASIVYYTHVCNVYDNSIMWYWPSVMMVANSVLQFLNNVNAATSYPLHHITQHSPYRPATQYFIFSCQKKQPICVIYAYMTPLGTHKFTAPISEQKRKVFQKTPSR